MIISYRQSLRGHLVSYGSFSGLNLSILTLILFHAPHSGHFAHISSGCSHIQAMTILGRFITTLDWVFSPFMFTRINGLSLCSLIKRGAHHKTGGRKLRAIISSTNCSVSCRSKSNKAGFPSSSSSTSIGKLSR